MPSISLCMIVKNEENFMDACLSSVFDIVDEIVIVDTGSTDKTKEICQKYTDKIFNFEWINDFSAARNFSFSKATGDFIMWMDADDVLLEVDRHRLIELKERLDINNSTYSMTYDYFYDESGNVTLSFPLIRLVRNLKDPDHKYWEGFIHEAISTYLDLSVQTDIHITHTRTHRESTRNLDIFEAKRLEGIEFSARDLLYYAKELHAHNRLDESIEAFNKYFSHTNLWVEDVIDSLVRMSDIHRQKDNVNMERERLYRTFEFDMRAEALYPLSLTFIRERKYAQAVYFLESIFLIPFPYESKGFIKNDEWNLKPLIALSHCYHEMGNLEKAKGYHEKAKALSPNHPTVIHNDKFFS